MWETSNKSSYYGKYTSGTADGTWLIDTSRNSSQGSQFETGWNNDYMLIGHALNVWVIRGGRFGSSSNAGVFATEAIHGSPNPSMSFRPVLILGNNM
ncbi:hypothetical protein D3C73_1476470 [compost metagenome]